MPGISGNRQHRIGRRLEQQVIDQRLVVEGDSGDLGGEGEDDVETADRKQVGLAGLEPGACGGALAPGAVPAPATLVRVSPVAAAGPGPDVPPESGGATMLDCPHVIVLMYSQKPGKVGT